LTLRTFHTGGIAGEEVKDITQGLPLAEMFFELHKQKFRPEKQGAIIAEIEGEVEVLAPSESKAKRNIRNVIRITSPDGETKTYDVPKNRDILVRTGERVRIGDKLTDGYVSPLDVLRLFGKVEAQRYIVGMIQSVYLSQGVKINPKHIEIVVRQMGKFCRAVDPGDSDTLIEGQLISREKLAEVNKKIEEEAKREGRKPVFVKVEDVLLGVKKAALSSDSFLSAASFQETSKVLAKAAFFGMEDKLRGLKENVIIGRRIPVGTGFRWYREFEIVE
jgi:DNA-directed RNA polymerase subunit beta'